MTTPTTPQARCEQIARDAIKKWSRQCYIEAHDGQWDFLKELFITALLAAEERGRQQREAEEDKTIGDFQDEVRELVLKLSGAPTNVIDGKCSDAGWQEFTLCEIAQGFNWLTENHQRVLGDAIGDRDAIIDALQKQQQSEPSRECMEIAERLVEQWNDTTLYQSGPKQGMWREDSYEILRVAIAAALQAERAQLVLAQSAACDWKEQHDMLKAHHHEVVESARKVIEQAVQALVTTPAPTETFVLDELETWLAEHPAHKVRETL